MPEKFMCAFFVRLPIAKGVSRLEAEALLRDHILGAGPWQGATGVRVREYMHFTPEQEVHFAEAARKKALLWAAQAEDAEEKAKRIQERRERRERHEEQVACKAEKSGRAPPLLEREKASKAASEKHRTRRAARAISEALARVSVQD